MIAGIVTDQCVDMAVRDAADRGYLVTLVDDACATYTPERHQAALRAYGGYCWITDTDTVVARLAALHATQKEVDALCKIVREQEKQAKNGAPVSALDTEFHRTLAAASHNQILEAIVELLRKKEEYSKAFEKIRRNANKVEDMLLTQEFSL